MSTKGNVGQGNRVMPEMILEANPERSLIRPSNSRRHIDFHIRVQKTPVVVSDKRLPLTLALVLDRSGSMSGGKLATAKQAALAVLDRLAEGDRAALVIFDDRIDILQPAEFVTTDLRARIRAALAEVQARGSTALHEGWLTGCRAIAGNLAPAVEGRVSRCFLLTDGLANVGCTDPEAIATEAAGVRQHTGIGTSTFGIGADYDEGLLGPMAVAGGGQFHHLRTADEITRTFVGELGEMLATAASNVRLELEVDPGITAELVSTYWLTPQSPAFLGIGMGDLMGGEERHIVIRFAFPPGQEPGGQAVRARLAWISGGIEYHGTWQEIRFSYASHQACDAEVRNPAVMHWVGLHHAERAKQEASEWSRKGDAGRAMSMLRPVACKMAEYADDDSELQEALQDLTKLEEALKNGPMDSMTEKEIRYRAQRISRGQRDHR